VRAVLCAAVRCGVATCYALRARTRRQQVRGRGKRKEAMHGPSRGGGDAKLLRARKVRYVANLRESHGAYERTAKSTSVHARRKVQTKRRCRVRRTKGVRRWRRKNATRVTSEERNAVVKRSVARQKCETAVRQVVRGSANQVAAVSRRCMVVNPECSMAAIEERYRQRCTHATEAGRHSAPMCSGDEAAGNGNRVMAQQSKLRTRTRRQASVSPARAQRPRS